MRDLCGVFWSGSAAATLRETRVRGQNAEVSHGGIVRSFLLLKCAEKRQSRGRGGTDEG